MAQKSKELGAGKACGAGPYDGYSMGILDRCRPEVDIFGGYARNKPLQHLNGNGFIVLPPVAAGLTWMEAHSSAYAREGIFNQNGCESLCVHALPDKMKEQSDIGADRTRLLARRCPD
jgi:hypothetical protein